MRTCTIADPAQAVTRLVDGVIVRALGQRARRITFADDGEVAIGWDGARHLSLPAELHGVVVTDLRRLAALGGDVNAAGEGRLTVLHRGRAYDLQAAFVPGERCADVTLEVVGHVG